MQLFVRVLGLALLAALIFLSSCDPDTEFLRGDEVELRFSTDTIMFDTVFTDRGSATRIMKVYNDASEPVKIDRIFVEGNTGVTYRFNADGFQGEESKEVIIWGGDSIFVFVEVFVDPTAPTEISPFVAEDKLIFETGATRSDVVLTAFGQNAFYLNSFNRGQFAGINCQNGVAVLPDDLPTVIFGSLIVDSCTLRALPGTKIYFHGGVQRSEFVGGNGFFNDGILWAFPNGRIELLGTLEQPIILSTDRLEAEFREAPAKYQGIRLGEGSRGNVIQHTEILNTIVGVVMDSASELTIENATIAYSGGPAISTYQADLTVRNSLFHSNFGNALQVIKGGRLTMEHTTIANFGVDATALALTNFFDDEANEVRRLAPLSATISNCIITGSRREELFFGDGFEGRELGVFDVSVSNSVVKTGPDFLAAQDGLFANFYSSICQDCVNTTFDDLLFRSTSQDDYRLDSLGVARNVGRFLPALPLDIRGIERAPEDTDAGAFEFLPGEN